MTATITSLSSRYAALTNELGRMTAAHSGPDGKAAMSRLILRAAILNARLHNDDRTVAGTIQAVVGEMGSGQ